MAADSSARRWEHCVRRYRGGIGRILRLVRIERLRFVAFGRRTGWLRGMGTGAPPTRAAELNTRDLSCLWRGHCKSSIEVVGATALKLEAGERRAGNHSARPQ